MAVAQVGATRIVPVSTQSAEYEQMLIPHIRNTDNWKTISLKLAYVASAATVVYASKYLFNQIRWEDVKALFVRTREYELKLTLSKEVRIGLVPEFSALMQLLCDTISQDRLTKVSYKIIDLINFTTGNSKLSRIVHILNGKSYKLTPYINVRTHLSETMIKESIQSYEQLKYTMYLSHISGDLSKVISFVNERTAEYDLREQMQAEKGLRVYNLSKTDNSGFEMIFDHVEFISDKTFDNQFFEGKDELLQKLIEFSADTNFRKKIGMAHTLGIFMHGEPGTGKTSTIKAIANYTNRHIIKVSLKKIKTTQALCKLFINERVDNVKIPYSKRLYVFEDIDCSSWGEIINNRSSNKEDTKEAKEAKEIEKAAANITAAAVNAALNSGRNANDGLKKLSCDHDKISLADFLEILDGIVEMPGRMVIITSNYPEKIDKAILRPGRIDINIEFKRMIKANINKQYELWFNASIPNSILENIPDYKFTQAEIGEIFQSKNPAKIFHELTQV